MTDPCDTGYGKYTTVGIALVTSLNEMLSEGTITIAAAKAIEVQCGAILVDYLVLYTNTTS